MVRDRDLSVLECATREGDSPVILGFVPLVIALSMSRVV